MDINQEWAHELADFSYGISQPCVAIESGPPPQEADCISKDQVWSLSNTQDCSPSTSTPLIGQDDMDLDLDAFLHESYDFLGLVPREEEHGSNTGYHGLMTYTTPSCDPGYVIPSQASSLEEAGPVLHWVSPPTLPQSLQTRATELAKSLKLVQRKHRKSSKALQSQAEAWNNGPCTNIFRLEKQKKRQRTTDESANRRLISKFGPCIPCFQSKTKVRVAVISQSCKRIGRLLVSPKQG
ncbi:hypothetical protein TWF718_003398 [Orbilia javanica]|uniref:Uncharacterized protein n=1 Tax=Orbilia javanica TaxID=47235 RepID=A0AAN8MEL5_9PEZI